MLFTSHKDRVELIVLDEYAKRYPVFFWIEIFIILFILSLLFLSIPLFIVTGLLYAIAWFIERKNKPKIYKPPKDPYIL